MNLFITLAVRNGKIVTLYTDTNEERILDKTFRFSQRAPLGKYDMLGLLIVSSNYCQQVFPLEVEYATLRPKPIGLRRVSFSG